MKGTSTFAEGAVLRLNFLGRIKQPALYFGALFMQSTLCSAVQRPAGGQADEKWKNSVVQAIRSNQEARNIK